MTSITRGWSNETEDGSETTVAATLDMLEKRSNSAPSRIVVFKELRTFPFRSKPIELSGVARISDNFGTSIEYPDKESVIIIDHEGLLLRRFAPQGEIKDRSVKRMEGELAELMTGLFRIDKESIIERFDCEVSHEGDRWQLALAPRSEKLNSISSVTISGDELHIQSIDIKLKGGRRMEMIVSEEREMEAFAKEDLHRYFRESRASP